MITRNLCMAAGTAAFLCLTMNAALAFGNSAQDFVTRASIANEFEIESSRLALEKSQDTAVKRFAQHIIDDHTKTADELNDMLESSDSNLEPADTLDNKHQKLIDTLEDASGDDFNHQYISMQVDAHKEAVSLFGDYSKHGKDKALRDFASQTLPTLRDHLKHARQLKDNE